MKDLGSGRGRRYIEDEPETPTVRALRRPARAHDWPVPSETAPGILERFPPEAQPAGDVHLDSPPPSPASGQEGPPSGAPPSRWARPKLERETGRKSDPRPTVRLQRNRFRFGPRDDESTVTPLWPTNSERRQKEQPPEPAPVSSGADMNAFKAAVAREETLTLDELQRQPSAHWIPPKQTRRDRNYWVHVRTSMQRERTRRIERHELPHPHTWKDPTLRKVWVPAKESPRSGARPAAESARNVTQVRGPAPRRPSAIVAPPALPRHPPAAYKILHFAYLRYEVLRDPLPRHERVSAWRYATAGELERFLDARLPAESPLRLSLEHQVHPLHPDESAGTAAGAFGMRWLIEQAWNEMGLTALVDRWTGGQLRGWDRCLFALVCVHLLIPKRPVSWAGTRVFFPELEGLGAPQISGLRQLLAASFDSLCKELSQLLRELFPQNLTARPSEVTGPAGQEQVEVQFADGVLQLQPGREGPPPAALCVQRFGGREVRWLARQAPETGLLDASRFRFALREGEIASRALRGLLARPGGYREHPERPELSFKCVRATPPGQAESLFILRRDQNARAGMLRLLETRVLEIRKVLDQGNLAGERLLRQRHLRPFLRRDARRKDSEGRPAGPVILDRMALATTRRFAGMSVIRCDAEHSPASSEIFEHLGQVETVFEHLKGRSPGEVDSRAELAVAVLAQSVIRYLECRSRLDFESLQRHFDGLRASALADPERQLFACSPLGADARRVLQQLGFELPPRRFRVVGGWRA